MASAKVSPMMEGMIEKFGIVTGGIPRGTLLTIFTLNVSSKLKE
jgi:hypothetical protein